MIGPGELGRRVAVCVSILRTGAAPCQCASLAPAGTVTVARGRVRALIDGAADAAGLPGGFVVGRLAGELESVRDAFDVELAMREQAWVAIERGDWSAHSRTAA